MKLTIVTHHLPNHQELADITSASKLEYATRWGYKFHQQVGQYSEMPFDFQRFQIIRDIFTGDDPPDVIWFVGCDTMIMNYARPITDVMGCFPRVKSFWIAKDINGYNDDSFVIRNSEWSRKWIDFILGKEPEYRNDCWHGQRVIQHFAETPEWSGGVETVPPNLINSYFYDLYNWPITTPGHFRKGDILLHLPGCDLRQRLEIFRSDRVMREIIR